jgi:hypothetical protein
LRYGAGAVPRSTPTRSYSSSSLGGSYTRSTVLEFRKAEEFRALAHKLKLVARAVRRKARRRPFDCYFGVGQPDGCHSLVWKVWAARNSGDAFITARWLGGMIKLSLHEPRPGLKAERHVALTEEYIDFLKSRQLWRGGSRHFIRWDGGTELGKGHTLEFVVRFPTADLRPFQLSQSDLARKVVWFTPAPEGQVLEVFLLYVPAEARVRTELPTDGRPQFVCAGRLADGRQVLLVASVQPDRPKTDQSLKLMQEAAKKFQLAGKPPSSLDDRARLVVTFELEGVPIGMRGFTEMAASSLG